MKFRLILAVALLLCVPQVNAAGLGWRVVDAEGRALYLVGTIHAARASLYPLPDAIERAFAEAEVLVLEVDVGAVEPRDAQRVSHEYGTLPRGASLSGVVGSQTWEGVSAWGQRLGIPDRHLQRMRPWLAAVTLVSLEIRALGLDPALGVERHLSERAGLRAMPIVELESLREQFATLASLSESTQVAFLAGSVTTGPEFEASLERIVESWRDGDVAGMTAVLEESYTEPELYDTLIRRRNCAWMPDIERMLRSGKVHFVAVGALHLVGDDSLLRLLQARGYRIERL